MAGDLHFCTVLYMKSNFIFPQDLFSDRERRKCLWISYCIILYDMNLLNDTKASLNSAKQNFPSFKLRYLKKQPKTISSNLSQTNRFFLQVAFQNVVKLNERYKEFNTLNERVRGESCLVSSIKTHSQDNTVTVWIRKPLMKRKQIKFESLGNIKPIIHGKIAFSCCQRSLTG